MLSLQAEIAACLFAVALLGLLCGWMMQRSRAARRLERAVDELEAQHALAEEDNRRDIHNLEERLNLLGEELRTVTAANRALRESSRGGEQTLDSARTEAIELNRRQAEVQERMQRIIQELERENATLRARLAAHGDPLDPPDGAALDETVRIDPGQLPPPRSVRPDGVDDRVIRVTNAHGGEGLAFDETLESTMDVAFLDAEEATIALDAETLSLVVRGRGNKG